MSLTIAIDALVPLKDVYREAGYGDYKAAQHAVKAGRFPIQHVEGHSRIVFTAANVAALTQRGEITNRRQLEKRDPRAKTFFGKGKAKMRLLAVGR